MNLKRSFSDQQDPWSGLVFVQQSVEGWKNVVLKGCVNCVTTKVIGDAMQAHPERCREYAEWSMCEVHYHYVQGGNLSRR